MREKPVSTRRAPLSGSFSEECERTEPYVEHREQAQRSNGGLIACFDPQVVRKAGESTLLLAETGITLRAVASRREVWEVYGDWSHG